MTQNWNVISIQNVFFYLEPNSNLRNFQIMSLFERTYNDGITIYYYYGLQIFQNVKWEKTFSESNRICPFSVYELSSVPAYWGFSSEFNFAVCNTYNLYTFNGSQQSSPQSFSPQSILTYKPSSVVFKGINLDDLVFYFKPFS